MHRGVHPVQPASVRPGQERARSPPTHDQVAPAGSRPVQARGQPSQPRGWPEKGLGAGEEAGGFGQGIQVRGLSGPRMQVPFPEAWPSGGAGGAFPLCSGRLSPSRCRVNSGPTSCEAVWRAAAHAHTRPPSRAVGQTSGDKYLYSPLHFKIN